MSGWGLAIYTMSHKRRDHRLFLYPLTLLSFLASCALGGGSREKKFEAIEQKKLLTFRPSRVPDQPTPWLRERTHCRPGVELATSRCRDFSLNRGVYPAT